jgi:ABC-type uncharacterized transport system ATPase subunit
VLSVAISRSPCRGGGPRLDDVSFEVRAGEIVGVAGVEGNGQTELIEALAGLVPAAQVSGRVEFAGRRDMTSHDARAIRAGIAHVPEDRHRRGLLLDFASRRTPSSACTTGRRPSPGRLLDIAGSRRAEVDHPRLRRAAAEPDLPARALSGGNQQKLIIGREFELKPKLLLVSQPTRGVDIGAIEFIHRKLVAAARRGLRGAARLGRARRGDVARRPPARHLPRPHRRRGRPRTTSHEEIGLLMTGGGK